MSSNPCNYMDYRGGDLRVAVRLQARAYGLSLQPIGCMSALVCDATVPQQLLCAFLCGAI